MSKGVVGKQYNGKLAKLFNEELREDLNRQPAHVLILRDLKDFERVFTKYNIHFSKQDLVEIHNAGKISARKLDTGLRADNPVRYNSVGNAIIRKKIANKTELRDTVFILPTWHSLKTVKSNMFNKAYTLNATIDEITKSAMEEQIHRGHGVEGNAVATVETARGFRLLDNLVGTNKLKTLMEEAFASKEFDISVSNLAKLKKLSTTYTQIVDEKNKLQASYTSVATFEYGTANISESSSEKELKRVFKDKFAPVMLQKIIDMPGSSSLKDKIAAALLKAATNIKGAKVKLAARFINPKASSGEVTSTFNVGRSSVASKHVPIANVKVPKPERSSVSLNYLLPEINLRLPWKIGSKMGTPALNWRTGTFAHSAEATSIVGSSINYKYDEYPYSIFELGSGSSLATPQRDPRKIIGDSVREIAFEITKRKFYTTRTY